MSLFKCCAFCFSGSGGGGKAAEGRLVNLVFSCLQFCSVMLYVFSLMRVGNLRAADTDSSRIGAWLALPLAPDSTS